VRIDPVFGPWNSVPFTIKSWKVDRARLCSGDKAMKKTFPDLPGWAFDMDEVSASVYEVVGRDRQGHCVSAKGVDLDVILDECRKKSARISAEGKKSRE
jgi:hypothetical protein